MGQSSSAPDNLIEGTVSSIHYEVKKQAQCLMEMGSLTYEDFMDCMKKFNNMYGDAMRCMPVCPSNRLVLRSHNCLDSNGKLTLFAVKKGSDQTFLWKATVRIACIKCDPETKKIESYNWIDLRQFLKIFSTFQAHLEAMSTSEEQHDKVSLRRMHKLLAKY